MATAQVGPGRMAASGPARERRRSSQTTRAAHRLAMTAAVTISVVQPASACSGPSVRRVSRSAPARASTAIGVTNRKAKPTRLPMARTKSTRANAVREGGDAAAASGAVSSAGSVGGRGGGATGPGWPASDVKIGHPQRVVLDELAARFDHVTHQGREDLVGGDRVLDPHAQQAPCFRVDRGVPELLGVHLAQALEALDGAALPGLLHQPLLHLAEVADRLAATAAADFGAGLQQAVELAGDIGDGAQFAAQQLGRRQYLGGAQAVLLAVHQQGGGQATLVIGGLDLEAVAGAAQAAAVEARFQLAAPAVQAGRVLEALGAQRR